MELYQLFGHNIVRIMGSMIIWGGADVIQMQVYCLMYRFCAIHSNPRFLRFFMSWTGLIIFHLIGYFITFSVSIPGYYLIADEQKTNYLKQFLTNDIKNHLNFNTPIIFVDMNSWIVIVGVFYISFMFLLSLILGFFMSGHIILYLKRNVKSFNKKTYKMHLQLTIILIIQQITPLFFMILPITTIGIFALTENIDKISSTSFNIGVTILAIYPSTNALICIIFITPYWNFTKKWIIKFLHYCKIIKNPADHLPNIISRNNVSTLSIVA